MTSPTTVRNGRGPSVGDSEKATGKKRVSPRIEDSHLPRQPSSGPLCSPLSADTLLARPVYPTPFPSRPSPPPSHLFSSLLGVLSVPYNLPGHLHPRYLASRPRRRLLIRGFTESKTLNARIAAPCRSWVTIGSAKCRPDGTPILLSIESS